MKKVVFTFGRMNPPTVGHQKLVQKVQAVAKQQSADARVYLSHTQNKKKDPLDYNSKLKYATKAFGSIVTKTNAKTIIQVLKELQSAGYTDVTLIVGSDRIPEFKKLLTKYNGKDYTFNSINFTSAGQRDPDAEGVEGMSASKMRTLAVEGDFASFKSGLPKGLQSMAKEVYNKLRNIMEEEDKELDEGVLTLQQRQKRSRLMKRLAKKYQIKRKIASKRMADSKRLQRRALKKARQIVRKRVAGEKGLHYNELSAATKITIDKLVEKKRGLVAKIAKKLLPRVRKQEMQRLQRARGAVKTPGQNDIYKTTRREERETLTLGKEQLDERIDPRREPNLYRALVSIDREKKRDLQKFDRMRDTARVRDTIYRNRKEEVDEVAQDQEIKDREGTQPAKYHSGLKKSTKATRDAQFKKGAEMSHKDPAAYPDKHAGDDTAKTRTSKHTKKYHDMFGEARKCTKEGGEAADFDMDPEDMAKRKSPPAPTYYQRGGAKTFKDLPRLKVQDENPPTGIIKAGYEVDGEYEITEESKGALQKKADKSGIPYSILKKVYDRGMAAWRTGHRPGAGQEQWAYARVNSFITKGKGTWGGADKDLAAKVKSEAVEFDEACWDGYKQVGMKKKGDKMVPDCVPEAKNPAQQAAIAIAKKEKGIKEAKIPHVLDPKKSLKHAIKDVGVDVDNDGDVDALDKMLSAPPEVTGTEKNQKKVQQALQKHGELEKKHTKVGVAYEEVELEEGPLVMTRNQAVQVLSQVANEKANKMSDVQLKSFAQMLGKSFNKKGSKYVVEEDQLDEAVRKPRTLGRLLQQKKSSSLKYTPPTEAEKEADRKKDRNAPSQYGAMKGRLKEDCQELGPEGKAKEKSEKNHKKKMLKDILPKSGAGQEGTDELVKNYKNATPGQGGDLSESVTGIGTLMTAADLGIEMQGAFAYHPSVEEFVEEYEDWGEIDEAAEYQGKKVKLNNPFRLPSGSKKKFGVYVKNDKGNVVKVQFGDPNMEIKRDDPKRRAAFRSRHSCDDDRGPKWKARYWSCYQWRAGAKVDN